MKMTSAEYAFLLALARYRGKIVTRRQLLREVRGQQGEGQTYYLRVYANHLRKKFGDKLLVGNEAGIGYRLLEPVGNLRFAESPQDRSRCPAVWSDTGMAGAEPYGGNNSRHRD